MIRRPLLLLLSALGLLALPRTLLAQASLNGRYVYDAGASDDIAPAINRAVRRLNFAIRPIARGRLTESSRPFPWVEIRIQDGQATVTTERTSVASPLDGSQVTWTNPTGQSMEVSSSLADGALRRTVHTEQADRVTVYTLDPGGDRLTLAVRLTSPRLAEPIVYNLVYDRVR
jgi:hypothetical protein